MNTTGHCTISSKFHHLFFYHDTHLYSLRIRTSSTRSWSVFADLPAACCALLRLLVLRAHLLLSMIINHLEQVHVPDPPALAEPFISVQPFTNGRYSPPRTLASLPSAAWYILIVFAHH